MKKLTCLLSLIILMMNFAFVDAKGISVDNSQTETGVLAYKFKAPSKRNAMVEKTSKARSSLQPMQVAEMPMRAQAKSNIEGYMIYNKSMKYTSWWNLNPQNATSTEIWNSDAIYDVNAGFVIDGIIYAFYYYDTFGLQALETRMVMVDVETGELKNTIDFSVEDFSQIVLTAAYDETEKIAYAYTYSADHNGSYFQKIDIETGEFTFINSTEEFTTNPILAMAYNPVDGKIYGITWEGELCTIDKATGEYSRPIMNIGFYPAYISQAMVYSPYDKAFIYVGTEDDEAWTPHTLVINMDRKEVVYDTRMTDEEQYTILYCSDAVVPEGAPSPAEIISISFGELAKDGEVVVRLPEETFDGYRLTGELTVEIKIDGERYGEVLTEEVGSQIIVPLNNMSDGLHKLTVSTTCNGVKGVDAVEQFYIGKDAPAMPQNIVLTKNKVTWDAVTTGAHNGYIEPERITYNVYLDGEKLNASPIEATEYDVVIPDDEIKYYVATVEAVYEGLVSEKGFSNEYLSGAYSVPAEININGEVMNYVEILDENGDGSTWKYMPDYSALEYKYNKYYDADDWALLPAIRISDETKVYSIEVDAETYNSSKYTEKIAVGITDDEGIGEMQIIIPETSLSDFKGTITNKFIVSSPGDYRIGLHALSEADNYRLRVTAIRVVETNSSTAAPAECMYISATAAEYGQLEATVNFTMPGLSIHGDKLGKNDEITVVVSSSVDSKTVTGKPGSTQLVTISTVQGVNEILLLPSNSAGEGRRATVSIFTGVDVPGKAELIFTHVSEDNKSVTFSWETSTVGASGGFVDPAFVTYQIIRYWPDFDYWFAESEPFEGTQYTYTIKEDTTEPILERLAIISINAAGSTSESDMVSVFLGKPYSMPLIESFEDGEVHYSGLTIEHSTDQYLGTWTLDNPTYYIEKAKHPNRMALIAMTDETVPAIASLMMPKFSSKGVASADVEINAYFYDGMPEAEVLIRDYTGYEVSLGKILGTEFEKGWNSLVFEIPSRELNKTWSEVIIRANLQDSNQYFIIGGYEFKEHSSVNNLEENAHGAVLGGEGYIILKGLDSQLVSIYTADGKQIYFKKVENECEEVSIEAGVYVVKYGKETKKVIVK